MSSEKPIHNEIDKLKRKLAEAKEAGVITDSAGNQYYVKDGRRVMVDVNQLNNEINKQLSALIALQNRPSRKKHKAAVLPTPKKDKKKPAKSPKA